MKSIISLSVFVIAICSACSASTHCTSPTTSSTEVASYQENYQKQDPISLDQVLARMKAAATQLKSCQTDLSYLFIQDPELLNSRTLRKGTLYYLQEKNRAHLRIRFDDLKQDDFEPEKQHEEYVFDGVWLKRIDYKLEQVDLYQQAPENKPIGVFELINHNFPLIGFSEKENLTADFDITLATEPNEPTNTVCLLLNVKKESKYKDYKKIDFWVDINTYLPRRVIAYSVQGDIYDIQFDGIQVNKKLENAVFTIETPAHFRKNIERLKEEPQKKGN